MLGVAAEDTFRRFLDVAVASPSYGRHFASAAKERHVLNQANKAWRTVEQQLPKLSIDVREDLEVNFRGILSIIRTSRNQSGHPTGKVPGREQTYVLINLFVPYCKKMHALMDALRA